MSSFGMPGPNGPWLERQARERTRSSNEENGYVRSERAKARFRLWFAIFWVVLFALGKLFGGGAVL